jgi:hypothetical protein
MRKVILPGFIIVFGLMNAIKSFSQPYIAPGTYSIPGTVTLTDASTISVTTIGTTIDALNTYGVPNAGTVQFNFADNYIETATATNGVGIGYYTLGSTVAGPGSALYNTIYKEVIFKHNGVGTKPKLYAYTGGTVSATDYIIRLLSVNNITFDGFDLLDNGSTASMEYGFKLETSSTGCTSDTIENCKIILTRTNLVSTGIYQTNSLATGGSNKYITYDKDTVFDSYRGMFINGNSVAQDIGNVVKRCVIGDAVYGGGDIGSNVNTSPSNNPTFGISLDCQQDVSIAKNQIRNVTYFGKGTSSPSAAGVIATNITGTSYIQENDIHSIKVSTASTSCSAYGISLSGTGTTYIHTNFISDITPPNSGSSSTCAWGIYLPGTTSGETVGVYNNSINFCGTSVPTYTACLEIGNGTLGSANGPTVDVKDNLFKTSTQTVSGSKKFYGIVFTSGVLTSSYNMFGGSVAPYYTGLYGAAAPSLTVAAWNTASGQDNPLFSNNTVPGFTSNTDLHLNFSTPNPNYQGVFITTPSITRDIDTVFHVVADPLLYPYMGADQFTNQLGILIAPNQPSDSIVNQTSSPQVLAGMVFTANGVSTTFTGLTLNTSGSYTPGVTDFSLFKLWIGSSPTFNSATFTLLKTISPGGAPVIGGSIPFSGGISATITSGSVYYIFVTDSVSAGATVGDYIGVTTTAFSNISFTGGVSKIGTNPVAASGFQRIAKFFYNYGNAYGTNYADITSVNGWYESVTGVPPIEFDLPYQVFQFIHNGSVMGDSTGYTGWAVSGTGAKIRVGDGINPITFRAKLPVVTSGGAVLDVLDKGVLQLQGKYMTGIVFGTLDPGTAATPGSTVEYGDSGVTANKDTLASTSYCNLTLSGLTTGGATRVFPSTLNVSKVFTPGGFTQPTPLKGNIVFNGALVTQTVPTGFLFRGLKINNTVGVTLLAGNVSVDSVLYIKTGGLTVASGQTLTLTPNAYDTIVAVAVPANILQVNGSFTNNNPAYNVFRTIVPPATQQTLLLFGANANYNLSAALGGTTGGQIPSATWAFNSNINITNVTAANANVGLDSIAAGAPTSNGFGNIYFDAPGLTGNTPAAAYNLFSGFTYVGSGKSTSPYIVTLQGNLVLGRTNNYLVDLTNTASNVPSGTNLGMDIYIGGNLTQYAGLYQLSNSNGTTAKNMFITGKDSINGSNVANPLYGTGALPYSSPVFNASVASGGVGSLSVTGNVVMLGASTINLASYIATTGNLTTNGNIIMSGTSLLQFSTYGTSIGTVNVAGDLTMSGASVLSEPVGLANLVFNGSTGNQNVTFQIINHTTKFDIEVSKSQVSVGNDTVKLASPAVSSGALTDTLRLTKGVFSIGTNSLTVDQNIVYRNPSTGAWDNTGTGTIAGSTSSTLNIGLVGSPTIFNPVLKFANNTAGSPYNNYLGTFAIDGAGSTATLGNALNIASHVGATTTPGSITVSSIATSLTTGGFLTLKSDASGTARVGQNTASTSYINGNVVIERYIQAYRAWRLLTGPINSSQTINASWQEGDSTTVSTSPNYSTPIAVPSGYGTQITNLLATNPTPTGYDKAVTNNPSLLYFDYTQAPSGKWMVPTATNGATATTGNVSGNNGSGQEGYMLFVRGDRTVQVKTAPFPAATTTILRTTGSLKMGTKTVTAAAANSNFRIVGNPYASEIRLDNLFNSYTGAPIGGYYYVWDPLLAGSLHVGAFVTVANDGVGFDTYHATSTPPVSPFVLGDIESGEAFGLYFGTTGSITIGETSKQTASKEVFRPADVIDTTVQSFRGDLYAVNPDSSVDLEDGTLTLYNPAYSDSVNWKEDAKKLSNPGENIALERGGELLAIEKRQPIVVTDTIFFTIYNMRQQTYQFQFAAQYLNQPDLVAKLEDTYLGTSTPVSLTDTTKINFTVTGDPASQGGNRFRIVFFTSSGGTLPVTFIGVKASQQSNTNIAVQWNVANQLNIKQYIVEKSTDGLNFTKVNTTVATASNLPSFNYNWIDDKAVAGDNYYRIISVSNNGTLSYSQVVKVTIGGGSGLIAVYPNPVKDGVIGLQFTNMPAGNYGVRLLSIIGQEIMNQQINHTGGSSTQQLSLSQSLAKGIYQLEIIKPDNSKASLNVMVQ